MDKNEIVKSVQEVILRYQEHARHNLKTSFGEKEVDENQAILDFVNELADEIFALDGFYVD